MVATALACVFAFAFLLATNRVYVPGVSAIFSAETENAKNEFAGGWVEQPNPTIDSAAGYGASLTWPWLHGAVGVLTQTLYAEDGGTTPGASACSSSDPQSAFTVVTTFPSSATTSYTDAGSSGNNGHWRCYRIIAFHGVWSSPSGDFTALRVGLYPVSVALVGNGNHTLDRGEHIVVTYNQNVSAGSVTTGSGVCQVKGTAANGFVIFGFSGGCAAGTAGTIGKISGITVNKNGTAQITNVAVTGNQITLTLGNGGQNITGTGTFTPSANVTSSVGGAATCTAAFCQATPTNGF